jgi:chorismate mutase
MANKGKMYGIFLLNKGMITNRAEAISKAKAIKEKHPEQYVGVMEIKRIRVLKPVKK